MASGTVSNRRVEENKGGGIKISGLNLLWPMNRGIYERAALMDQQFGLHIREINFLFYSQQFYRDRNCITYVRHTRPDLFLHFEMV